MHNKILRVHRQLALHQQDLVHILHLGDFLLTSLDLELHIQRILRMLCMGMLVLRQSALFAHVSLLIMIFITFRQSHFTAISEM